MTDQEMAAVPAAAKKPRFQPVRGVYQHNGAWWIHYTDASGRRRRERAGCGDGGRTMAINLLAKRKAERLRQEKLPETLRRKPVMFREIAADCLEYSKTHKASAEGDCVRMPLFLAALGDLPAASITPQHIERALAKVSGERNWKPATFNRAKALLSLTFRLALQNGKVAANPCRAVRRKREDNQRVRWLTAEEEERLVAVIEQHYPAELPAFMLSLHTGMRRSEQYRRIAWDGVDFERRQLWIPGSKNGAARHVPLNNAAIAALLSLRDRGDGTGKVMRAGVGGHGKLAGEELKTPKEWFAAAVRKAGLADYTWHCNRHTFASRLVMAGVSLLDVKEILGHKSIQMTCRYAHLAPEHKLEAVRKLDGWGRAGNAETATKTATGGFGAPAAVPAKSVRAIVQ